MGIIIAVLIVGATAALWAMANDMKRKEEEAFKRGYIEAIRRFQFEIRSAIDSAKRKTTILNLCRLFKKMLDQQSYPVSIEDKEPFYSWVDGIRNSVIAKDAQDDEE